MLTVERLGSAQEFLTATIGLRSREPVLTNVMGSVATSVVAGRRYDRETWLVAREEDDVVGCAMRTAPWPVSLSPMSHHVAAAVGRALLEHEPQLDELAGPADVVRAVVAALGDPSYTIASTDVARVLGSPVPPRHPCPGRARPARAEDAEALTAWMIAFADEAGLPSHDARPSVELMLADDRLLVWEVGDIPVAMAGHAPTVDTPSGRVGRIGPVYTTREHRRRGFGAAVTYALARRLRQIRATVMLFTDAENPDSNSVYSALGFDAVAEVVHVRLAP